MFHTICLFKRLSLAEYKQIDTILPENSRSFLIQEIPLEGHPDKYIFRRYGFVHLNGLEGVSMYLTKKKNHLDGFVDTRSYLHLVINPKVIINKDYISVANEVDAVFALHEIDKFFYRIRLPLTCADFKPTRIDCCFNYQFLDTHGRPSDEMANDYMKLLKKGKDPTGFKLGGYYCESGRRFVPYQNSLNYTQSYHNSYGNQIKNVVINVYNKHEELRGKIEESPYMRCSDDEENAESLESINYEYERDNRTTLDNAYGIVRFEVQLYYQKLYNTTRSARWGFDSLDINNFISDHFTETMLIEYLCKICFAGDYFTLEKAREKIIAYPISHQKTKEGLLTLLSQVSRQRGWKAAAERVSQTTETVYENTCDSLSHNKVKNLLNWLDKIGVNPVTIPKGWSSDFFPSPINIIKDAIRANAKQHPYDNVVPMLLYDDYDESLFHKS